MLDPCYACSGLAWLKINLVLIDLVLINLVLSDLTLIHLVRPLAFQASHCGGRPVCVLSRDRKSPIGRTR